MSFQIVIFNITEKSIIEHITAKSYNTAVINRGVHFKMKKVIKKWVLVILSVIIFISCDPQPTSEPQ